jgi:hypothetical protein
MVTTRKIVLATMKLVLVTAVTGAGIACVVERGSVRPIDPKNPPTEVKSPVRAHLVDGSTVV